MSIPPRFAAIFCRMKTYAVYFSLFVHFRTMYPSGRNVMSAMSFAMSMEPMNVM